MVKNSRKKCAYLCCAAPTLAVIGCSLVNQFDALNAGQTYTGEPVAPSQVGDGAPDPAVDAGPDGAVVSHEAGAPRNGVIVVGGTVPVDGGGRQFVLTALDPTNGRELSAGSREPLVVAGLRFDGTRDDLWYIFESSTGDFVPGPADQVFLHVRYLDRGTGAWTELQKLPVPVLQNYDSIVVLRERIVYIAYDTSDSGNAYQIITLNTSDVTINTSDISKSRANVSEVNRLPLPRPTIPTGMVGAISSTGPGGTIDFIYIDKDNCDDAGTCPIITIPLFVPNSGSSQFKTELTVAAGSAPSGTSAAVASFTGTGATFNRDAIVVTKSRATGTPASVSTFDRGAQAPDPATYPFGFADSNIRSSSAQCQKIVFVVGANADTNLWAVPLAAGVAPLDVGLGHSGQSVYFEPTTSTVLAPFNQGEGRSFSPFILGGTPSAPTLTPRSDWPSSPPVGPNLLAIRQMLPITCPP